MAGVDSVTEPDALFVFIAVQDEPYHFWVRVEPRPHGPQIAFVGYCPEYRVSFDVSSDDVTPDQITAHIGLSPTETREKGSSRLHGARPFPRNQWTLEPFASQPGFLEDKLSRLFAVLATCRELVSTLPATCSAQVSVMSYQWQAWPEGFHLSPEHLASLQALRASFDLDLYVGGPIEPAT
ncbi:MAG: DUF4279 domain-containing protein [Patescibacteria group bacterium]|nr:DUF4279 domain-containing protein [Patescibacteria group bacterium]